MIAGNIKIQIDQTWNGKRNAPTWRDMRSSCPGGIVPAEPVRTSRCAPLTGRRPARQRTARASTRHGAGGASRID